MTNEEALLMALNGVEVNPEATFQPQNNEQAYLAYGVGLITDSSLLPSPQTIEQDLLLQLCLSVASGGGGEGGELPALSKPATAALILATYEAINKNGAKITGTMPDNGAVSERLTRSDTSYTVPAGYHDGNGKVYIDVQEKTVAPTSEPQVVTPDTGKLLGKVIVEAVQVGGVQFAEYPDFMLGTNIYHFTVDDNSLLLSPNNAGGLYHFKNGMFNQIRESNIFSVFMETSGGVYISAVSKNTPLIYWDKETEEATVLSMNCPSCKNAVETSRGFVLTPDTASNCDVLLFDENTKAVTVIYSGAITKIKTVIEMERGMLLGSGNKGLLYYDFETGESTLLENSKSCQYMSKVDGGAIVSCTDGVYYFNEETKELSLVLNAAFAYTFHYKVPGGYLLTSASTSTGVAYYDEATMTAALVYEGNACNFSVFAEISTGVLISGTGSSYKGILFFDYATKTCAQVYTTGYGYDVFAEKDGTCLLASSAATNGIFAFDLETQTVTSISSSKRWIDLHAVKNGFVGAAGSAGGLHFIDIDAATVTKVANTISATYDIWIPVEGEKALVASKTTGGHLFLYDENTDTATEIMIESVEGTAACTEFVVVRPDLIMTFHTSGDLAGAYVIGPADLTPRKVSDIWVDSHYSTYEKGNVLVVTNTTSKTYEVCVNKDTLEVTERPVTARMVVASRGIFYV